MDLNNSTINQLDLFTGGAEQQRWKDIYAGVDEIDAKFGKHSVFLGSSLKALNGVGRGGKTDRQSNLFDGENKRQRLNIPFLNFGKWRV